MRTKEGKSAYEARRTNMQRDALVAGIVVLIVGVLLIPISQLPRTEIRDILLGKQIVQIPDGESSFEMSLESNTRYQMSVKGNLVAPYDPVEIDVITPDNSSIHAEFPREDPKFDFQTLESSGIHNITFESAYAGSNTRAEVSKIVSLETIEHPYTSFLVVGIAFAIVGTVFTLFGWKYPIRTKRHA